MLRARMDQRVDVGAPVVVVGNVTVGGTGKTPTIALVEALRAAGFTPGIGYGARPSGPPVMATGC